MRDVAAGVALGLALVSDVDGGAVEVGGDGDEGLQRHLVDLLVVHRGHAGGEVARLKIGGVHQLHIHEAVGVGETEAAQQHAVDDGKHRRDAADAEGQHGNGHGAKALFFEQDAEADAKVLEEGFEEHKKRSSE